jgi:hypothetical protein
MKRAFLRCIGDAPWNAPHLATMSAERPEQPHAPRVEFTGANLARGRIKETPMKATKLTLAAVLLAGSCSFAFAQAGGAGGEPPRGSDAHPPAAVQQQGSDTRGTPAPGASSKAATSGGMKSKATGMPNNSTGNMNTKGTGKGTTGTGGPGGSGNK